MEIEEISKIKKRVFGLEAILADNKETAFHRFDIREIFEELMRAAENKEVILTTNPNKELNEPPKKHIFLEQRIEETPNVILYETNKGEYIAYFKISKDNKKSKEYEKTNVVQYQKSDITVRSVPEHILGVGVLGRAFIFENYIEILDTLVGHDYHEVLTHEMLHIAFPHYSEIQIRQATKNYVPNSRYN